LKDKRKKKKKKESNQSTPNLTNKENNTNEENNNNNTNNTSNSNSTSPHEPAKRKTKEQQKEEYDLNHLKLKISTSPSQTVGDLKDAVAYFLRVDPRKIRLWERYRSSKLLKNLTKKFNEKNQMSKDDKGINKYFWLEIVSEPEDLSKGDRFQSLRHHKQTGELVAIHEIKLNKNNTLLELKQIIKQKTGVPVEKQVVSQWWNDAFFSLYHQDKESIKNLKILKK